MRRLFIFIIIILSSVDASAQRINHNFNNVTMPEVLRQLNRMQNRYTINFIFNDLEDFRVTANVRSKSVHDAIQQIIGFYPIETTIVSDSIINVECSQKTALRYKGRVVDASGQPIEFANVALLSPSDSTLINGGVTNSSGYFVIPCESNKVILRVSYVGFKTYERVASSPSVGTIHLNTAHIAMKGVTVKAQRPQYKMAKGGMTIDVENSVLSKMGTAIDVLAQLPRVSVNGNNVKVFAKGTPLIYINNKKVTNSQELNDLKSENIKNVDVITSPGAQYDATVRSVIRIHTRKPLGEGLSVSNYAMGTYNTMWAGREYATVKYRVKGFEVESNTGLYSETYKEDNKLYYTLKPTCSVLNVNQKIKDDGRENIVSLRVKASYDFDADNSIGGSYWYYKTLADHTYLRNGSMETFRNGNNIGSISQNEDLSRITGPRNDANIYYTGKLGKWAIDFNGSYVHIKSMETVCAEERSGELEDRDVKTAGGQKSDMWAGKLVITYPIGKGELSFGSEYSHTKSLGFYVNEQNYIPSSETKLYETNIAGFADFTVPFGNYSLSTGLRYEHVKTDYYSFVEWEKEPSRRYGNFFPNVSLSWNKDLWSWQASYSMKTDRPSYRNLRNFMQYDGRYVYEGGNPYLRPEYDHNIELSAIHKWLSISAGYSYYHKVIITSEGLYDNQEFTLMKPQNAGHQQSVYASIVASPRFGVYRPSWEVDYAQLFFQQPKPIDSSHPFFSFVFRNYFVLPHDWMASLNLSAYTDNYDPLRYNKGYFTMSAQLRKSFFHNHLVFNLQADDLTKGAKEIWTMYGDNASTRKDCYNFNRQIKLTITYNFNASRSRYKGTGAGNAEKNRL